MRTIIVSVRVNCRTIYYVIKVISSHALSPRSGEQLTQSVHRGMNCTPGHELMVILELPHHSLWGYTLKLQVPDLPRVISVWGVSVGVSVTGFCRNLNLIQNQNVSSESDMSSLELPWKITALLSVTSHLAISLLKYCSIFKTTIEFMRGQVT